MNKMLDSYDRFRLLIAFGLVFALLDAFFLFLALLLFSWAVEVAMVQRWPQSRN